MFRSMTGYGRATSADESHEITVELKSVNSKFLDLALKLPRQLSPLENRIKAVITESGIGRGRIDVYVNYVHVSSGGVTVVLDDGYTRGYIDALRRLRDEYGLTDDISVMSVAQNHDIFTSRDISEDLDAVWEELLPVITAALGEFMASREKEGAFLLADIGKKLRFLRECAAKTAALSEHDIQNAKERIRTRITAVLADNRITVDENRLLTECAVWADKIAIDEELVRLNSHLDALDDMLVMTVPVGRKFDFQLQEANREINTIGSKCQNAEIAGLVVKMKNEAEKIREQIQNIE